MEQQSVGDYLSQIESSLADAENLISQIEERLALGSPQVIARPERSPAPRQPLPGHAQSVAERTQSLLHRLAQVGRAL